MLVFVARVMGLLFEATTSQERSRLGYRLRDALDGWTLPHRILARPQACPFLAGVRVFNTRQGDLARRS